MVIIWLMMVNNNLIGGIAYLPLWKIWVSESQLGWWHSQLIWKNTPNIPNHQAVIYYGGLRSVEPISEPLHSSEEIYGEWWSTTINLLVLSREWTGEWDDYC